MSFTLVVTTMLLSSSVVNTFVLQSSKEEPTASANSPVSNPRCQGGSLQFTRKSLLGALNLQTEPQLRAGGLDGIREHWRTTFSTITHRAMDTAVPAASGYSVSPNVGNSTGLRCCSMATEISMTDLGWDNWIIHPASLTIVQCALCNPKVNTGQCPSPHANVQDAESQVPCCEPISQEMVPVLYMDEFSNLVISSVHLTRSCGCDRGNLQPPSRE
ncbi:gonadal somatic cell derived factor [Anoplopoma fimbria]|uniref:Gonadal soma-derived factor n=1 Tax=Anoplopoma fimbria TaxID=229290 RepID=S5LVM4_ANOFI|nr:gonadal somatic cell derived factor [Anoplopoma fimbria]AGR33991.1 putative gonadal soma-derived factor [Anoplopoma fimbria]QWC92932.1 gonadal soma-derived factor [Anoplopoma fimbria]